MSYNPLAEQANAELSANGCNVLSMLSERGKAIFFPRKGILGQGAEAKGSEINATIGTALEDDGSPLVLDCVLKSLNLPKQAFLYAPSFGNPDLRKAWKEQIVRKNPSLAGKQFSNPVVTCALTHAISCAGYLFLDPGDEVIIPDLYWDNYELVFVNSCGAKIKTFNTFKDGGFDTEALKKALAESKSQKKVVLLNFPNNPTGYTATEKEAVEIAKILTDCAAAGNKVVALLDDAYFGLVYEDGVTKESLFVKLLEANENLLAVKLDGPTKEDYVWGFRVGFMTFGFKGATAAQLKALEDKAAGTVRGNISNAPSISQKILLAAFQSPEYLQQKQQHAQEALRHHQERTRRAPGIQGHLRGHALQQRLLYVHQAEGRGCRGTPPEAHQGLQHGHHHAFGPYPHRFQRRPDRKARQAVRKYL